MHHPLVKQVFSILIFASIVVPVAAICSVAVLYDLLADTAAGFSTAKDGFKLWCKTSPYSFVNCCMLFNRNGYNSGTKVFMHPVADDIDWYVHIHRLRVAMAQ